MPGVPPLRSAPRPGQGPRTAFGDELPAGFWHESHHATAAAPLIPGLDEQAERVPFDWRRVRLHQVNGDWTLEASGHTLARLGPGDEEARLALAAVMHYRFTEEYRVGRPELFSYFLVNGQPPQGSLVGVPTQPFQPETVTVQAFNGHWALWEGDRLLLDCGDRAAEARKLLDVIREHKFDRLCRIGAPGAPGMTFFVRSR